jgi:hypothetical protein
LPPCPVETFCEGGNGGVSALQTHLARYQVDAVLFENRINVVVPPLVAQGWRLVHLDDYYWLMVRQAQGLPTYDIIRPWTNVLVTPGNAAQVLQEATRALEQCPQGATFAWAYQAEALRLLGRDEESFEAARKVPERLMIE